MRKLAGQEAGGQWLLQCVISINHAALGGKIRVLVAGMNAY